MYKLSREVIELQRATHPLLEVLGALMARLATSGTDEELRRHLRDVVDRLTEASYAQNEQIKRISSWAAILFAPTLIGTVYGMNFTHMPELRWTAGYPFAILLMALTCVVLHRVFKHRGWL